ncbi:MAG: response regulator [Oscillospiraceae bacterium]|nr:response regulator [Oscillospiraceae bacterium]
MENPVNLQKEGGAPLNENPGATQTNAPGGKPAKKEKKKIIAVDDVAFHLLATRERFKAYYDIFPAQSAADMYDVLKKITPDLILLDINMPDVDGFELLKRLKSSESYRKIPVIFLSAKNAREDLIKAMRLGAVDFIKKPYSDADFMECVDYHLNPEKPDDAKAIILAVDDNPSILKTVRYLLGDTYNVYVLSEPTKVASFLDMVTPDLFLLDCKMPELSGFDVISIIREQPAHKTTPIVFLTSENDIDTISEAIKLGASDFMLKPINDKILSEKIAPQLEGLTLRRRIRQLDGKI